MIVRRALPYATASRSSASISYSISCACSASRARSNLEVTTSEAIVSHSSSVVEDLTDQQQRIVDAPIDTRQLVLGGAGTGKTHVLVERIRRLIDAEDVAPATRSWCLALPARS